ncbi:MAG: hypothetical protein IH830_05360 [Planctomycetes bacterium]|nr:hypothetical protein [Planctomycetota bacterium]
MPNDADILASLRRIEDLLRTITKAQLAPIIQRELCDDKTQQLYELTGTMAQKDICKALSRSASTVSDTWKRWERLGLLTKDRGHYRKVL